MTPVSGVASQKRPAWSIGIFDASYPWPVMPSPRIVFDAVPDSVFMAARPTWF